ncbi:MULTISPECIES: AAA family ATPase [unclassified Ensifer]|uniref:AAA family ATPase n=1 Tax=unclassified Ensifer TaxID=2633371 RepID=UPI0008137411|nr:MULTISPECIES: AAA family ATPase [unclassified Ensifer]OCP17464.1 hypothetical protein BC361_08390 [Ensifer sp. LC54]OCP28630.1 hypothetical protein BC363_01965 [Ensifer sp. LC384]
MLDILNAIPATWDLPEPAEKFVAKHSADEVATWERLREGVANQAAKNGWTKAETGRRIGMAESSFSQWLSGTLLGVLENQNAQVRRWLDALEESAAVEAAMPEGPHFLRTLAAREVHSTLLLAQTMTGFVTITLAAGRGKTTACREYQRVKPHVHMVTLNPKVKTVHGVMSLLSRKLGVRVFNPADLVDMVGERLSSSGDRALLIIDEAQHADAESVNQLRYFSDNYRVGLALVGNEEVRKRMTQAAQQTSSRDQILSRIDKNLKRDPGREADVRTFIDAWNIQDPSCVKLLFGIGLKGGALRQIDRTVKMACLATQRPASELERKHLEAAWNNREVEEV